MFKLLKQSKKSSARLGRLKTSHGIVETPFFMPIATKAAVKNLDTDELKELGAGIILSNTYHLYLTPGMKIMKAAGGLHRFMNWPGPILTDSGGFQVFSLSKIRKILPGGIQFRSHLDGSKHVLTPRKVLEIQKIIGSDIAMILDVCPPSTASRQEVAAAVATTTKWAEMAYREIKKAQNHKNTKTLNHESTKTRKQLFFAIIQGGIYKDLRLKSLEELATLDFDGYAIGGLAVGETNDEMYKVLDYLAPQMPADKPRYLMGVGKPENIIQAVKRGVDMFDCVIPTREARHGRLYLWNFDVKSPKHNLSGRNRKLEIGNINIKYSIFNIYSTINITNSRFKNDFSPINSTNLNNYSKAYLHHLFKTNEPLGMRLATLNNLEFYLTLMKNIRQAIKDGKMY